MTAEVSAILVAYSGAPEALEPALRSLRGQTLAPAEIICADQSPDGRFAGRYGGEADVRVLCFPENLGYPSACNRAAAVAGGEHLMFLNPDAEAEPDCLAELVATLEAQPNTAIAGAQVLLADGTRVNAGDNGLHLTGVSWAGRFGLPPETGPARPAAVVSGAAMLVRRSAFQALGGYTEGFFMYYDDVDLAWRARLMGWEVLFCPKARVRHDYEFSKGGYKWRYLERNRWWCLLAHLELRTLIALAPLLAAVEAAIMARALADGWFAAKLGGWRSLWRDRRALASRRHEIQRARQVGDRAILARMSAAIDSPFLASPLIRRLHPLLELYRRGVLAVAGGGGSAKAR